MNRRGGLNGFFVEDWQTGIAGILFVTVCSLEAADPVLVGDDKTKEHVGVVDQVGAALKNTATRIEQEVSSLVQKLEESETLKNVGNELKRPAESLGQKAKGREKSRKSPSSLKNDTCEFPGFLKPSVLGWPCCYRFRNPKNIPTAPAPVEGR
jgi:hypothetical protein